MAETSAFRQLLKAVTTGNYGAGAGDYPEAAYQTQGEAKARGTRLLQRRQGGTAEALIAQLDHLMKNKGMSHSEALATLKPEEAQVLVEHYAGKGATQ